MSGVCSFLPELLSQVDRVRPAIQSPPLLALKQNLLLEALDMSQEMTEESKTLSGIFAEGNQKKGPSMISS